MFENIKKYAHDTENAFKNAKWGYLQEDCSSEKTLHAIFEDESLPAETIFGFNVYGLFLFAQACAISGITNDELHSFVNNVEFAFYML